MFYCDVVVDEFVVEILFEGFVVFYVFQCCFDCQWQVQVVVFIVVIFDLGVWFDVFDYVDVVVQQVGSQCQVRVGVGVGEMVFDLVVFWVGVWYVQVDGMVFFVLFDVYWC